MSSERGRRNGKKISHILHDRNRCRTLNWTARRRASRPCPRPVADPPPHSTGAIPTGDRAPPATSRPPACPLVEPQKRSGGEAGQKNGGNEKKKKKKTQRGKQNETKRKKNTHTYLLTHTLSPSRPSPTDPSTHHTNNPYDPHPPSMVHDDCSTVSIYI